MASEGGLLLSKIVIIGAGFVGSTTAYACMLGGTAQEIVLFAIY